MGGGCGLLPFVTDMYVTQAQQLVEDLHLERLGIPIIWYAGASIPGHGNIYGLTHPRKNGRSPIEVATGSGFYKAMIALAHELRHAHQKAFGLWGELMRGKVWYSYWNGSRFVPGQMEWPTFNAVQMSKRDWQRYANQPHERDARAYADWAWETFFKDNQPKTKLPPRNVSDLNDFFL